MSDYVFKNGKKLKKGYTTGVCAAAASKAAVLMLLSNKKVDFANVTLPIDTEICIPVYGCEINSDYSSCYSIKDGGDDPDVTNGMRIYSKAEKINSSIVIDGGIGIGRVLKDGLKVKKGMAAINPAPMKLIHDSVKEACLKLNYYGGIKVTIYAPEGVEIAKKTFNSRLGIEGGISILGTTGIVEPMSEQALIDTIKAEIDVIAKYNTDELIISPGNYGRNFAVNKLELDFDKGVKCSNFIGEAIDYAVYKNFKKIVIIGHAGKLIKIAGGIFNTHSKTADCRMEIISAHAAMVGIDAEVIKSIMQCINVKSAFDVIENCGLTEKVLNSISDYIKKHISYRTKNMCEFEFFLFDDDENILIKG